MICGVRTTLLRLWVRVPDYVGFEDKSEITYFSTKTYVVTPQMKCLNETTLIKGHNKYVYEKVLMKGHNILCLLEQVPGRVAQSVGHLTCKSGVLGSIPGLATYFRFSFSFLKKGSCQLLAKVCARSTV